MSVWNADTAELVNRLPGSSEGLTAEFSPAADEVIIADTNSPDVRVWPIDQAATKVVFRAPGTTGVATARFDPTGKRIVYVDNDGRLAVRDLEARSDVALEGGPKSPIYDAQFSADGARVAVSTESGQSAIWRVDRPARPERLLERHRDQAERPRLRR